METLEQAVAIMEKEYGRIYRNLAMYNESGAYKEFVDKMAKDLKWFKIIVADIQKDTSMDNVVLYLVATHAEPKYLKMAQGPFTYFQETDKLKTLMDFGY